MNSRLEKIAKFILKRSYLQYLAVLFLFFAIFAFIQFSSPNLAGTDAYYHIKHAYLIRMEGFSAVTNFPWISYSIINKYPTDFCFFYHILLIPFTCLGLITGLKIAGALFSSLIFVVFFFVLRQLKIKYAFLWTLVLFGFSSSFVFRLILARDFILSISFFLLGLVFLLKKKRWGIFIVSFFYALTYVGCPFLLAVILLYTLVVWIFKKKIDLRNFAISFSGMALAFLVRPDFPNNLRILFYQDVMPFLNMFKGLSLPVGAELSSGYSLNQIDIMRGASYLLSAFFFIFLFSQKKRKTPLFIKTFFLFSLFIVLLLITFISGRFIEYLAPLSLLLMAFIFENYLRPVLPDIIKLLKERKYDLFKYGKLCASFLILSIILAPGIINFRNSLTNMKGRTPLTVYKEVANFLKENTQKEEVVFNINWADFPLLFFYNDYNAYTIGMDPNFLYLYNKELYWQWFGIGWQGIVCQNKEECFKRNYCAIDDDREIAYLIKNNFKSKYIFINTQNHFSPEPKLFMHINTLLKGSSYFEKVFQGREQQTVKIFKIL
ncbi:hypothetical protein D4R86_05240 [bacterium]|nr:MAG: hypothetical protein D4R86_05240 [bacterium]